jgi:hypothetical protein
VGEYTARQTAIETGEGLGSPIQPVRARKRWPVEAKESTIARLLLQAIHLAGTRRGRLSQAAIRRAQ